MQECGSTYSTLCILGLASPQLLVSFRFFSQVFDVTKFLKLHPGGKKILLGVAGQECTEQFNQFHNASAVFAKYGPKLIIGEIESAKSDKALVKAKSSSTPAAGATMSIPTGLNPTFGDMIPSVEEKPMSAGSDGAMKMAT